MTHAAIYFFNFVYISKNYIYFNTLHAFSMCIFHVTSILKHHILKQKQNVKEMSKRFEIYETERKSGDKTTFL